MAIKQLPLNTESYNFEFRIPLDGKTFTLAFRYNQRAERWMMDVRDNLNTPIKTGLAILGGAELIERFVADKNLPDGSLFFLNIEDIKSDISFEGFGENGLVMYEESA